MSTGNLYLVATPIGNLEDLTYRAVRVLREADLIACEDTRHTRKLLEHYGIDRPTISYHQHNEQARTAELLERLQAGTTVALVSDAGTPLISDPGYRLVARAAEAGIAVVPVPGASAILTALTASGLPTDSFYFGGFLPAKAGQRRRVLETVAGLDTTLVFYEAPHRILESLADIGQVLGERRAVLTRELTKVHEEFVRGTPAGIADELRKRPAVKGEMTLVIGKAEERAAPTGSVVEAVDALVGSGMTPMDAIKAVARERGLPKRAVYDDYERK